MTTAYVYDPIYLEHDLPGHPENKRRLERTMSLLEEQGMLERLTALKPSPISMERLQRNHSQGYIDQVRKVSERGGGHLDPDTYVNSRSYDAALVAAGGLVDAVEAMLDGQVDNAFAMVRPPGHHALTSRGMGFCLFNNVAVAAHYALEEKGLERILTVDFDVHHGNGTQEIFYDRGDVLVISFHQRDLFPFSGRAEEIGEAQGRGHTLNIPVFPQYGDGEYTYLAGTVLRAVVEQYLPQIILVSAGFDGHRDDPLAGWILDERDHVTMTRGILDLADETAKGRVVSVLEGGYDLRALAVCVEMHVRELM